MFGSRKYLLNVRVSVRSSPKPQALTLPHPYSHTWTFLPFFALLILCVIGVYVIGIPFSSNSGVPDIVPGQAVDVCGDLDEDADAKLPSAG